MKKIFLTTIAAAALTLTSCSDYLDVNENPNSPSEENVSSSILMPAVEMNLAGSYGDFMRIVGGYFSQHYAQEFGTSNYIDYSAFYISATRSSSCYTQLMQRAMSNDKTILAKSADEPGTFLAATVIRAFTFEALVDCYGEIPYTEALDENNNSPVYDEGEAVYRGILAELDAALANQMLTDNSPVCTNFLYQGQTAKPWIKFANALKLRILTRCVDKCTDLQSELDQLVADEKTAKEAGSSIFPDADVAYSTCWANESGSFSPYYAEEFSSAWGSTQINVIPNIAILGTMQQGEYDDPRMPLFWTKGSNGKYNGYISSNTQIVQGTKDNNGTTCDANYFSRPQAAYNMPVVLISSSDVCFYLSEYYAKKSDSGLAKEYYEAGVAANITSAMSINPTNDALATFDASDALTKILAQFPYDQNNWKKCIGLQKWICNAGINGYESWCEMRRMGVPSFDNPSVTGANFDDGTSGTFNPTTYVPGTLYTPRQVRSADNGGVGANCLNQRWPYPESSTTRNSNAPATKKATEPVFWAK